MGIVITYLVIFSNDFRSTFSEENALFAGLIVREVHLHFPGQVIFGVNGVKACQSLQEAAGWFETGIPGEINKIGQV